jgi:GNAT superfamily N-acetyltransferase
MTDMLVKLYQLPAIAPLIDAQAAHGIAIRRAMSPEKHVVLAWISAQFEAAWLSETDVAFARNPISCWIAVEHGTLIGFGCYDCTARGFFGPTGVGEAARGRGTGKALLVACLHDMWMQGYGYAVIGGVGPASFYASAVGATVIEGSSPGLYGGLLHG